MNLYGLIGFPLGHSFSKQYFSEKFQKENFRECAYENFEIPDITLLHEIRAAHPNLKGLNVTIPYKESVMPLLDEIDQEAAVIGSVNCIKIQADGSMKGYNTDAYGFYHSVKPFLENKYERALILGTGGSSKAVHYVLSRLGLKVFHATRQPSQPNHIHYNDLSPDNIKHFPLIINSTPLGMYPQLEDCPPIPYEALSPNHFLYDLIYNPTETLFLKQGRERGAHTSNGLLMLQLQAEKSWQLWHSND